MLMALIEFPLILWLMRCQRRSLRERQTMMRLMCIDSSFSRRHSADWPEQYQHTKKLFWFKNPWVLYKW
jgi:hypothetical protein